MASAVFSEIATNFARTDWATITLAGLNVVQVLALAWITAGPTRRQRGAARSG